METKANLTNDDARVLENIVWDAISKHEASKQQNNDKIKLYTINSLAKKLGMAHKTVKTMCEKGFIATTASGLITEAALNDYLTTKNKVPWRK